MVLIAGICNHKENNTTELSCQSNKMPHLLQRLTLIYKINKVLLQLCNENNSRMQKWSILTETGGNATFFEVF